MNNLISDFDTRIEKLISLKSKILEIERSYWSPLYIFDKDEVINNYNAFVRAFKDEWVNINVFYATKSNPYQWILNSVVELWWYIDVSSQYELKKAIEANAKKIIYTWPTKNEEDFEAIIKCWKTVYINLESIREMELLSSIAKKNKKRIKCWIRITVPSIHNKWVKFWIPIDELRDFYDRALEHKDIDFCWIHFHISWNITAEKYVQCLSEISTHMEKSFNEKERSVFKYLDIWWWFYYKPFEAMYSWNENQNMSYENDIIDIDLLLNDKIKPRYKKIKVDPIKSFAKDISKVYKSKIIPLMPNLELFAEPWRLICNSCMHFMFKAIEMKKSNICIANWWNYMIWWERFQYFNYSPIFNLSQFDSENEIPTLVYWSLCTADDIWWYYVYSKWKIKQWDILLMPYKWAYDYTLAQNFIREIPQVIDIWGC